MQRAGKWERKSSFGFLLVVCVVCSVGKMRFLTNSCTLASKLVWLICTICLRRWRDDKIQFRKWIWLFACLIAKWDSTLYAYLIFHKQNVFFQSPLHQTTMTTALDTQKRVQVMPTKRFSAMLLGHFFYTSPSSCHDVFPLKHCAMNTKKNDMLW